MVSLEWGVDNGKHMYLYSHGAEMGGGGIQWDPPGITSAATCSLFSFPGPVGDVSRGAPLTVNTSAYQLTVTDG